MAAAPELMGGFVLKTGDVEYDYSLKGQLERLNTCFRLHGKR